MQGRWRIAASILTVVITLFAMFLAATLYLYVFAMLLSLLGIVTAHFSGKHWIIATTPYPELHYSCSGCYDDHEDGDEVVIDYIYFLFRFALLVPA